MVMIGNRVLQSLIDAIRQIGDEARESQGQSAREFKEDGTYVTETDRTAECRLRSYLHQCFPEHRVLGEENGLSGPRQSKWTWVIDPIDGTTNYTLGLPIWAVSLGLLEGGTPLWGCVYIPVMDQLFLASRGRGAILNDRPIAPSGRCTMETEDLFGIASGSVKRFNYQFPQRIRAMGSAAAQTAYVASGHYVGYFLDEWCVWDIAAAMLIALEAGVEVTDMQGAAFNSFPHLGTEREQSLLFAAPGVHAELLKLIIPKRKLADP